MYPLLTNEMVWGGFVCVCVCLFCWFVFSAFFLINNEEFIFILLVLEL